MLKLPPIPLLIYFFSFVRGFFLIIKCICHEYLFFGNAMKSCMTVMNIMILQLQLSNVTLQF
jgi:hypothetical protein